MPNERSAVPPTHDTRQRRIVVGVDGAGAGMLVVSADRRDMMTGTLPGPVALIAPPRPPARQRAIEARATDRHLQRLLLVMDGAAGGATLLDWVADRARYRVLDLDLVSVVRRRPSPSPAARSLAAEVLRRAEDRLALTAPSAEVRIHLLTGDPLEEIERMASSADMVVLPADDGPSSAAGLRSAARIAVAAQRSVVVVPGGWTSARGRFVFVVWRDGSDLEAVRLATDEAVALDRGLVLLHPAVTGHASGAHRLVDPDGVRQPYDDVRALQRQIGRWAPSLAVSALLLPADARGAAATTAALVRQDAALIVGTASRMPPKGRVLTGGDGRDVVEHLTCPIVVAPPGAPPDTEVGSPRPR